MIDLVLVFAATFGGLAVCCLGTTYVVVWAIADEATLATFPRMILISLRARHAIWHLEQKHRRLLEGSLANPPIEHP